MHVFMRINDRPNAGVRWVSLELTRHWRRHRPRFHPRELLSFPEHVATATSHAVLSVTALIATAVHVVHGDYGNDAGLVIANSVGAVIGAPIGSRLSKFTEDAIPRHQR
jgi:hypothetical protein